MVASDLVVATKKIVLHGHTVLTLRPNVSLIAPYLSSSSPSSPASITIPFPSHEMSDLHTPVHVPFAKRLGIPVECEHMH